jgi:GIY-YIG catalytic domain
VSQDNLLHPIAELRQGRWRDIPDTPGVYWWYFPPDCLVRFQIDNHCTSGSLFLQRSDAGRVCLYHGMATSLRERIAWHSEQKLTDSALQSGFLSTFRFTLLALTGYDYAAGAKEIDGFMDGLAISRNSIATAAEAQAIESVGILGQFHYPLNLSGNRRQELKGFHRYLKLLRKEYKRRHLKVAS